MHMSVLPAHMSVHPVPVVCPLRPEEGIRDPWTGVTDVCVPCWHWDMNLGPLEGSFQPLSHLSLNFEM